MRAATTTAAGATTRSKSPLPDEDCVVKRYLPFLCASVFAACAGTARAQDGMAEGRRLFTQAASPVCAVCHTLRQAEASGQVGPDLDELRPDTVRVEKAIRNGIGQMPANTNLNDEQIRLLAKYVASVAGK